jgi:hypothetical protein
MHSSELKFISTTSAKCTNQSFDLRPDFKQELKSGRRDGELDACILPLETHQGQVGFTNVILQLQRIVCMLPLKNHPELTNLTLQLQRTVCPLSFAYLKFPVNALSRSFQGWVADNASRTTSDGGDGRVGGVGDGD